MKLNRRIMAMAIAGTVVVGGVSVSAIQKAETVTRHYKNIQVKVDGEKEVPVNEPFMIGNSVYVGLRDAGDLVGAQVGWDGATNTVTINTDQSSGADAAELEAVKSELGSKNLQLATANSKIAELEAKIKQYEEQAEEDKEEEESKTKIDMGELEDMLFDDYEDEYDVEWLFDIKGDERDLELTVKYDSGDHGDEFEEISDSELKGFMEELCDDLQREVEKEYDIDDIEIEGIIYDKDEEETVAEFDMDDRGRFDYEYVKKADVTTKELEDYEVVLEGRYKKFPYVNMVGYDSSSIKIDEFKLKVSGGDIIFEVHTNMPEFGRTYWDRVNKSQAADLEEFLINIQEDVEREFKLDAEGVVYDNDGEEMATYDGTFYLE